MSQCSHVDGIKGERLKCIEISNKSVNFCGFCVQKNAKSCRFGVNLICQPVIILYIACGVGRGAESSCRQGSVLVMMAAEGCIDQAQSLREHGGEIVKRRKRGHESVIL